MLFFWTNKEQHRLHQNDLLNKLSYLYSRETIRSLYPAVLKIWKYLSKVGGGLGLRGAPPLTYRHAILVPRGEHAPVQIAPDIWTKKRKKILAPCQCNR